MPEVTFPLHILRFHVEGLWLGLSPALSEISRLGRSTTRLDERLVANLIAALPKLPAVDLHRRAAPEQMHVDQVQVTMPPPSRVALWSDELRLTFPIVRWSHGAEAHVAFVPALGLQVAAVKLDELIALLPREIVAALQRGKLAASLRALAEVQRIDRIEPARLTVTLDLPSPKRRAVEAQRESEKKKSILDQVGTNLGRVANPAAYRRGEAVDRLAEALTGRSARSVLLVGPGGVGKTATFRQLVRERRERDLRHTPFYATSGSRLVAGQCGYGMWQQRCRDVCREAAKRKAILHLGNLVELMDVGKSEGNPSGVASFLRPAIARGEILAVAECTPEQLPLIEREDPQLVDAFQQLAIDEPGPEDSRTILQLFAYDQPPATRQALSAEVLDAVERLHRRYATYSAFPGRPLRFLQNLLNDAAPLAALREEPSARKRSRRKEPAKPQAAPMPIALADIYASFSRETGLPRVLLDPAQRLDLAVARDWFAARVIGQPEAVDLVTDLIGTVKAGLARPGRPIASLLFVGPTGVGKTEMAKALAEYLFGSTGRLTRFDMSEFADPVAVRRLVGAAFGAEGLLTAKVREQPFSVVLLDEFEKAHPTFFDLLLQVMGEGRLTDAAGRLADFRNSVVILTSNLGAETFQAGSMGFEGIKPQATSDHFTRAAQSFLRPEMFNRIDRVVAFSPLPPEVVRRIADRQLDLIARRDGVRYRGLELRIEPLVADWLAATGYDARYGARPLKRAIERELLAPLAAKVNEYSSLNAVAATVALAGDDLTVLVRPRLDALGRPISAQAALPDLAALARDLVELRRRYQRLERCTATMEFRNEWFQLDRREKAWLRILDRLAGREGKATPKHPLNAVEQTQLAHLRALEEELSGGARRARAAEDEVLTALHGPAGTPFPLVEWRDTHRHLERSWGDVLRKLYVRRFPHGNRVTIGIFSETRIGMFALAAAYREIAGRRGWGVEVVRYGLPEKQFEPQQPELLPTSIFGGNPLFWHEDLLIVREHRKAILQRWPVPRPTRFLATPHAGTLGIGMDINGEAVFPFFDADEGAHQFQMQPNEGVEVRTSGLPLDAYFPPEGVTRRGGLEPGGRRRTYDLIERRLHDAYVKEPYWSASDGFSGPLETSMQAAMWKKMMELLDE